MMPSQSTYGSYLPHPQPYAPVAPQFPVVIDAKAARLFFTDAGLGWQTVTSKLAPHIAQQGVPLHQLLSLQLIPRLSWGQAALWLVFAAIMGFGGSLLSFLVTLAFCTAAGAASLFLRRRYFLAFVLRDGRRFEVFLGDGYPPSPLTPKPSAWVSSFMHGWGWLGSELHRRGVAVMA